MSEIVNVSSNTTLEKIIPLKKSGVEIVGKIASVGGGMGGSSGVRAGRGRQRVLNSK